MFFIVLVAFGILSDHVHIIICLSLNIIDNDIRIDAALTKYILIINNWQIQ